MDNAVRILRKTTFLVIVAVCVATTSWAQSVRSLMKDGNKFFENENYRAAIPFYEKVLAKEPNNETALFRAGGSCHVNGPDPQRERTFQSSERCVREKPGTNH